jgi:Uncharacterized protein conserved in bacteria (DUF2332)
VLLTSFVWPFDLHRHERLSSALAIAEMHPVHIEKASAGSWLPEALAADGDELPVVWHSITQMYWPIEEVTAVESILTNKLRRTAAAGRGESGIRPPRSAGGQAGAAYPALESRFRPFGSGAFYRHGARPRRPGHTRSHRVVRTQLSYRSTGF